MCCALSGAMERFPALETTEMHTTINGPESFTPDNHYIVGEAPNLDRFFVAAVRKNALFWSHFLYTNDVFTKTGSGQI